MKIYVSALVFILLSYVGFAGQTESTLPYQTSESVSRLDAPAEISKPQKPSWKARLLTKTLAKKLKKKQKKGGRPVHPINWLSFGSGLGSWVVAAVGGGLFLPLTVAAIVFGIIGIGKAGTNKDYSGEGLGIAGLSIGAFNVIVIGLVLIIFLSLGG